MVYGFRTLIHCKGLTIEEIIVSLILVLLVAYDLSEIWMLSSLVEISEDQFDVF